MKSIKLVSLLTFIVVQLSGYTLVPSEQIEDDGKRLVRTKHLTELKKTLTSLSEENTTASGWPLAIPLYNALVPTGGPRWEDPKKIEHFCSRYYKRFGETPEYRHLKVNHLLLISQYAKIRGLDGDQKIEDWESFVKPYIQRANIILESFPADQRGAIWYHQKGTILSFKDEDLAEWIAQVREQYPLNPNLLLLLVNQSGMGVQDIEFEIDRRNLPEMKSDILYAQVISSLIKETHHDDDSFLDAVNWDRHMKGLALRHELYPTDFNYDVYRYFACYLGDKELARELFLEGPERPKTYHWTNSEFPFEDWRVWATGDYTFPKLEDEQMLIGLWKVVDSFAAYPKKTKAQHLKWPVYYIYDGENKLRILGNYRGGMNHRTRTWEIISPGHVKIKNLTNDRTWSQTMFCDGELLAVQHLAAPYGTTYLERVGPIEELLRGLLDEFYGFNPSKKPKK